MNSLPLRSMKWHYIGSDNKTYGPLSSEVMLQYYGTGYFHEDLMLSYDGVNFYVLRDWIQICGKLPFTSEIGAAEVVNRLYGQSDRPHFRTSILPNGILPQSLPFHAAAVNSFNSYGETGIVPQQMGVPMPSDSMSSANTNGNSGPPFFPTMGQQSAMMMCDSGVMLPNQFPDMAGLSFSNMGGEYAGSTSINDNSQINYSAQLIPMINKCIDTSDMPWNRRTDKGTHAGYRVGLVARGTQTVSIQLPRTQVETLLSEMLGISVNILPS